MTARIFALDSEDHRKAQELLPWFVSGTLTETEGARVARHVDDCIRCQTEAAAIAKLRSLGSAPLSQDVERGWSALLRRVEGESAGHPRRRAFARPLAPRRLQIAVVLQAAIILVLALALLWSAPRIEPYRTLGASPAAAEANAVGIFKSDATQTEMAEALRAAEARIVGGPTAGGAYLLHLDNPAALAPLRTHPGVLSVTSLNADGGK